jgi:hypothetical protein
MSTVIAPARAVEQTITAVITRADGSVEDLGIVSYYHRRWYRRWIFKLKTEAKGAYAWLVS